MTIHTEAGWPSSNPFLEENTHPSRRSQLASNRNPRTNNNNNPSRPDYQRSTSSGPFIPPLEKTGQQKTVNAGSELRKFVPIDTIDNLDRTGLGPYHHEGPYDATLASRQIPGRAPIEAVKYGNAAALAATPRANVVDSLTHRVPLQGVGLIPPGEIGPGGQKFDYEEEDIMHVDGRLGRWPGVDYRDEDIKGKGEPGYTQDLQENETKTRSNQRGVYGDGRGAIELQSHTGRKRSVSDANPRICYGTLNEAESSGADTSIPRKFESLKKRFSFRSKKPNF